MQEFKLDKKHITILRWSQYGLIALIIKYLKCGLFKGIQKSALS